METSPVQRESKGTTIPASTTTLACMALASERALGLRTTTQITHLFRKLTAILNAVVQSAKAATDPDVLVQHLDFSKTLSQLLEQAKQLGALSAAQLRKNESVALAFVDKARSVVADGVGDAAIERRADLGARKRVREVNLEDDTVFALKRPRSSEMYLRKRSEAGGSETDAALCLQLWVKEGAD